MGDHGGGTTAVPAQASQAEGGETGWAEHGDVETPGVTGGQRHHHAATPEVLERPGQVDRGGLGTPAVSGRHDVQNAAGGPVSCHHGGSA